jgi:inner membrane protein
MLAMNHVLLATGVTFAGSVLLEMPFFLPFIIFVAVAALMPDIDHKGSEMSKLVPVINAAFPHRGITHSLFAVAFFGGIMYILSQYYTYFSVILLILGIAGLYFLEKVAHKKLFNEKSIVMTFFSEKTTDTIVRIFTGIMSVLLFFAMILIWNDLYRDEIIILLVLGYAFHLVGDFVTKDGIPLLWPISKRLGLKLFRTGGPIEGVISFLLIILNGVFLFHFITLFEVHSMEYWNQYIQWII